ncbi:MAG: asparagine synthase (glutamine-hydrolyzing) [Magnetococcales bacterium]|nr:asparagine synthase (glutamine-hydrolyzing) [Magnetococcales bacterium]MBF0439532.1 asparagine synthase (glutamine-hydrolyzing) [Magnetococcales bacterium]
MCGFAGFVAPSGVHPDEARVVGERMGQAVRHRGPDDGGLWIDEAAGVVLSHRRLSILDLSATGHQPMISASGRYVIAFNGEIYNHLTLREQLLRQASTQGGGLPEWRGHSDTETLLHAIQAWGLEETLRRSVGMFALALWDQQKRILTLARDRIGEKPLYYGWQGRGEIAVFLFGSELKALKAHPSFEGVVDREALTLQLRHNYVPAPWSIYLGIHKLLPGHTLQLSLTEIGKAPGVLPTCRPYWLLADVVKAGRADPFDGNDADAVVALESLLREAVSQQMVADVPLGAFLSGGIDSSTVVALMQTQSQRPVKTFTIGFHEKHYNEAEHAKAVASHLGTEHTELYVTHEQAMAVIPRLPTLYDEPFSDSSQIPTYLLSQLAKEHVTVSLSGDAGDELFGGYNRYRLTRSLWRRIRFLPTSMRRGLAMLITRVAPTMWDRVYEIMRPVLPEGACFTHSGDKLHKLAAILASQSDQEIYRRLISHWNHPADLVIGAREPNTKVMSSAWSDADCLEHGMMFLDAISYLPDDILVKVDRAAMGVSLESRIPFLDHRVVEFAWHLPLQMKIRQGQSKWILRQVLYKYVPRALMERPKMGFGVPIDDWLRGPLRAWAENLLDEARLRREGFFDPTPIRRKWAEHCSSQRNWQDQLWDVLMFQAWLEANVS